MVTIFSKKRFGRDKIRPVRCGFNVTKEKLNRYFGSHLDKRFEFERELEYLNQIPDALPDNEKLLYSVSPYEFVHEYRIEETGVLLDRESGLHYVLFDKKKLFFPKGFADARDIRTYFTGMLIEQDKRSPHCYLGDGWTIAPSDVIADIGAAEGIFALSLVDKVKHAYLFEPGPGWAEALRKTFEPWRDKVTIVNKLVGDKTDGKSTTIGDYFADRPLTVIKMDIEGSEFGSLSGSKEFLRDNDVKLAITTYHNHSDADRINKFLRSIGYTTSFNRGNMLYIYDRLFPPYFRKVLLKAEKGRGQ